MFRGVTTLKLKFGPTKTSEFIENSSNKSLSWENVFTSDSQVPKHPPSKNNHLKHPVLNFIGYHLDDFESLPWKKYDWKSPKHPSIWNHIVLWRFFCSATLRSTNISERLRCHRPNLCALEMSGSCRCTDPDDDWLVVSTPLKNISQIRNLPQVGVKIKNIWNHHLDDFSIHENPWAPMTAPMVNGSPWPPNSRMECYLKLGLLGSLIGIFPQNWWFHRAHDGSMGRTVYLLRWMVDF